VVSILLADEGRRKSNTNSDGVGAGKAWISEPDWSVSCQRDDKAFPVASMPLIGPLEYANVWAEWGPEGIRFIKPVQVVPPPPQPPPAPPPAPKPKPKPSWIERMGL